MPAEAREAIWYAAREALTNVERHAGAASLTLTLEHPRDGWLLRVADDGTGIRPADLDRPEHYGMVGMRERMKGIGGTLCIQPAAELLDSIRRVQASESIVQPRVATRLITEFSQRRAAPSGQATSR